MALRVVPGMDAPIIRNSQARRRMDLARDALLVESLHGEQQLTCISAFEEHLQGRTKVLDTVLDVLGKLQGARSEPFSELGFRRPELCAEVAHCESLHSRVPFGKSKIELRAAYAFRHVPRGPTRCCTYRRRSTWPPCADRRSQQVLSCHLHRGGWRCVARSRKSDTRMRPPSNKQPCCQASLCGHGFPLRLISNHRIEDRE